MPTNNLDTWMRRQMKVHGAQAMVAAFRAAIRLELADMGVEITIPEKTLAMLNAYCQRRGEQTHVVIDRAICLLMAAEGGS